MKVIAKKNRELALINAQNTQNENRAETITLVVPEEYENYNKKIVFITSDGNVWDVITNNEYKITNAITKYEKVDFYIWLTKEVDGESIDFRTKTKTLNFYHNEDASDEITDEEIHGVNTVVNLLEEEIEKVENLNIEATKIGDTTTVTITKKDGTTESVDITDGQNGQDGKDGEDGKDAKINGKNSIEIEAGNNITIDNTETGIRINSTNDGGTTDYNDLENKPKINNVELSGNKSLNDLGIQPKGNYIEDNNYVHTDNNFNNTYKNKLERLENYDDTEVKADISDIQDEQVEQNTDIENLQEENARLKATLPTTTGEGQAITLNKTAELEFKKPPLPMGNSEQVQTNNLLYLDSVIGGHNDIEPTLVNGIVHLKGTNNEEYNVKGNYRNGFVEINTTQEWKTNTTYYISCKIEVISNVKELDTSYFNCFLYGGNSQPITKDNSTGRYIGSITTPASLTDLNLSRKYVEIRIDGMEVNISEVSLKTVEDYTFNGYGIKPSPEHESPITNVTGDVEVVVGNKNWFNKNNVIDGYRLGSNGTNFANPGYSVTDFIKVKPSTNFYRNRAITIMEAVCLYDKDKNFISRLQNGNAFTTTENTYYIKTDVENTYLDTTQLELGSTSTPYTPHKEQVLPLTLGNIELCKIGDYQDYFYKESNKWYLHKEIAKVVFNGNENWNLNSNVSTDNFKVFYLYNAGMLEKANILCDKFKYINSRGAANCIWTPYSTEIDISISSLFVSTSQEFKTWLSTNNILLYYPLKTPTDTEITDTTLISQLEAINNALSYEEQTNISSNTIALFSVEAYQDAKVILAEKGTYSKPSTGIPKSDLSSSVQTSLGKADTALQSHQDISGKANKISVVQTSASTIEINSNTFYKFGEVASLNITLASITDNTIYNEYMFEFVSGTTATTLTLPSSIKWLETPTIDANKIYQCSIVDNVGLLVGVANV